MDRTIKQLTLSSLVDLDPRLETLITSLLIRAAADCRDRPELDKPRLVKFQIECTPIFEDGECADVNVQVFVDDKHPPRRTKVHRVGINRKNALFFSPDNPADIRQPGLGFDNDGGDE